MHLSDLATRTSCDYKTKQDRIQVQSSYPHSSHLPISEVWAGIVGITQTYFLSLAPAMTAMSWLRSLLLPLPVLWASPFSITNLP